MPGGLVEAQTSRKPAWNPEGLLSGEATTGSCTGSTSESGGH